MRCVGIARPKMAMMSATEAVSASVPSTEDAQRLTEMGAAGEFGEAEVFGPLALDWCVAGVGGAGQGHYERGGRTRGLHGGSEYRGGEFAGQGGEVSGRLAVRACGGGSAGADLDSVAGGERGRQSELDCAGGAVCAAMSWCWRSIRDRRRRSSRCMRASARCWFET